MERLSPFLPHKSPPPTNVPGSRDPILRTSLSRSGSTDGNGTTNEQDRYPRKRSASIISAPDCFTARHNGPAGKYDGRTGDVQHRTLPRPVVANARKKTPPPTARRSQKYASLQPAATTKSGRPALIRIASEKHDLHRFLRSSGDHHPPDRSAQGRHSLEIRTNAVRKTFFHEIFALINRFSYFCCSNYRLIRNRRILPKPTTNTTTL